MRRDEVRVNVILDFSNLDFRLYFLPTEVRLQVRYQVMLSKVIAKKIGWLQS